MSYELQYRTEMTSQGRITGVTGWLKYPHVHSGFGLEDLKVEALTLKLVYQHVRIIERTTTIEVIW